MIVTLPHKDETLLYEFRHKINCEHCRKPSWGYLEPHHLWGKGMGGWARLDLRINLISLCRVCHQALHDGNILRCTLLALVAQRENLMQGEIEAEINRLLWGAGSCGEDQAGV